MRVLVPVVSDGVTLAEQATEAVANGASFLEFESSNGQDASVAFEGAAFEGAAFEGVEAHSAPLGAVVDVVDAPDLATLVASTVVAYVNGARVVRTSDPRAAHRVAVTLEALMAARGSRADHGGDR
jgi:hypothetical protein